jgi:hypothetical protein
MVRLQLSELQKAFYGNGIMQLQHLESPCGQIQISSSFPCTFSWTRKPGMLLLLSARCVSDNSCDFGWVVMDDQGFCTRIPRADRVCSASLKGNLQALCTCTLCGHSSPGDEKHTVLCFNALLCSISETSLLLCCTVLLWCNTSGRMT